MNERLREQIDDAIMTDVHWHDFPLERSDVNRADMRVYLGMLLHAGRLEFSDYVQALASCTDSTLRLTNVIKYNLFALFEERYPPTHDESISVFVESV